MRHKDRERESEDQMTTSSVSAPAIDNSAEARAARRDAAAERHFDSERHVRRVRLLVEAMRLATIGLKSENRDFTYLSDEQFDGLMEFAWVLQEEAAKMEAVFHGKEEEDSSS